mmetsp:Transcript_71758/g.134203  ORF Transcript_71758/g.134203 Transcript_71758/m.134203 type:complete len:137 (-) Transcript_71758:48-458(-)
MMKTLLFVLLLAAVALAARPHVAAVRNEVNLGAEYEQDMERLALLQRVKLQNAGIEIEIFPEAEEELEVREEAKKATKADFRMLKMQALRAANEASAAAWDQAHVADKEEGSITVEVAAAKKAAATRQAREHLAGF